MKKMSDYYNPWFLYIKKHKCTICGSEMKPTRVKKIVNSESLAAKDFDFWGVDFEVRGDVMFSWDELLCSNCGYQIKASEYWKMERDIKRMEKRNEVYKKEINYKYIYSIDREEVHLKKHVCPVCNKMLQIDYYVDKSKGNIEHRIIYYKCKKCSRNYSLDEINKYEEKNSEE